MKILFLTPWYPHEVNTNSGVFIRDQAELAQQQHQVTVVFSTVDYTRFSLSGCSVSRSEYHGITEYRVVVNRSIRLFNQAHYLLRVLWHTWMICRAWKPDVIQANVSYPSSLFAWGIQKLTGCPYFVVEHTRMTNLFRSGFHAWATRRGLRNAAVRLAVSRRLAAEVETESGLKTEVLPNVVDTDRFTIAPFPASVFQLGFLGALYTPVKGLDILLEALAQTRVPLVMHIGGRGPLLEKYRALAEELGVSDRCRFYGFVPHAELPEFMSRLHAFVSSSRYETFGVVIAEAMAAGLPVIVTRSGGPEDYVTEENGMLVPVGDVKALASAIERMSTQYTAYDREANATKIKEAFSKAVIRARLDAIYARVASTR